VRAPHVTCCPPSGLSRFVLLRGMLPCLLSLRYPSSYEGAGVTFFSRRFAFRSSLDKFLTAHSLPAARPFCGAHDWSFPLSYSLFVLCLRLRGSPTGWPWLNQNRFFSPFPFALPSIFASSTFPVTCRWTFYLLLVLGCRRGGVSMRSIRGYSLVRLRSGHWLALLSHIFSRSPPILCGQLVCKMRLSTGDGPIYVWLHEAGGLFAACACPRPLISPG